MNEGGWRWPVSRRTVLPSGQLLTLRPLERADRAAWTEVRRRNRAWLAPWEATVPGERAGRTTYPRLRRSLDRAARDGLMLPFVVDVDGALVGQMQLFDVLWGSRASGWAGYWLDEGSTGRGYATWALATLVDHALLAAGLHRVDVGVRPENTTSLAVVQRLAMPEEGVRRELMHVDGGWRDHRCFAVVAADLAPGGYAAGGLVEHLRRRG
ncbi:GNAT family N-acetyltransferase [Ornithinimicrobium avium]|uniref:N-acetyltransferase n=1 Tax=Ornithinimicrobium avium TaxID=2283195 RepID=A0A345NQF5_9MICO|nr:GNAT family protein [Ornithinimicrobium avium]AXH97263.1 N-acetyltransferase [Ornithinimicrobium avium]